MEDRPKILVMCPDLPFPIRAGGQMRMASLIQGMAEFAKVHVVCIATHIPSETLLWAHGHGVTIENFSRPSSNWFDLWHRRIITILTGSNLLHSRREQRFLDGALDRFAPDLVWVETPYLLRYTLSWKDSVPVAVDYWGTSQGAERIYKTTDGIRKTWRWLQWRAARQGELSYAQQIRNIITVSRLDAGYFQGVAPDSHIWPIPIGIFSKDEPPKRSLSPAEHESKMILTGDMSYLPNIDAGVWFAREIFPLIQQEVPDVEFHLVGRDPSQEVMALAKYPGVKVKGFVPDLAQEIANSSLYVLPMRLGSGIRSKLFEVFPLGKPIISTTIGAEGLELYHNKNCLIADSSVSFAKACIKLLKNEEARKRLGSAARRLATDVYSQESTAQLIRQTVGKILRNWNGRHIE